MTLCQVGLIYVLLGDATWYTRLENQRRSRDIILLMEYNNTYFDKTGKLYLQNQSLHSNCGQNCDLGSPGANDFCPRVDRAL